MIDCADRQPGETCEACGAVIPPKTESLPGRCFNLEAREDRAREMAREHAMDVMERAGGSVVEAMMRIRAEFADLVKKSESP